MLHTTKGEADSSMAGLENDMVYYALLMVAIDIQQSIHIKSSVLKKNFYVRSLWLFINIFPMHHKHHM